MRPGYLVLFASVCVCASANAQESSVPQITVYGTATTAVEPDEAVWSVNVSTMGQHVPALAEQHANEVAAVLKYLAGKRLIEGTLQSSNMRLDNHQTYRGGNYVKEGYEASTSITFQISDLKLYREIWVQLALLDGVTIRNVEYRTSQRIQIQDETRIQALQAALAKAKTMADSLGVRVGEPLRIQEQPDFDGRHIATNSGTVREGSLDGMADLAPGRIPITITVTASFRLLSRE